MRIWRNLGLLVLLLVAALLIVNWRTIKQSYHWLNYSKYQKRTFYFQNQEQVFDHRVIDKSKRPFKFPKSEKKFRLPETFAYQDSIIQTNRFIEQRGYEGIIILHKGSLVYENYWLGMTEATTHSSMSMSKSILSILVGMAIDDGLIKSTQDLLTDYLPEYKGTLLEGIRIVDCLDMLSGIAFCDFCETEEDYATLTQFFWHFSLNKPLNSFVSNLQVKSEPGKKWDYQTMDAILIGLVLDKVLESQTISQYAHDKLWDPIGAEYDAQWIMGGSELELVGSNFTASLRDYAKLGQLYLQKGRWQNKQLLSEDWIVKSTIPDKNILQAGANSSDTLGNWGYKHFWWIPDNAQGHEFMAAGRFGQILYVNMQKEVVIVGLRIGPDPEKIENESRFNLNSKVYLFQQIAASLN